MSQFSIVNSLLNFAGLTGSSFPSDSLVPPDPTSGVGKETGERAFRSAGDVGDPDIWSMYQASMTRPVSYTSMLQLWDQMSSWDLIAATLIEIVDEATQTDSTDPATLWYECNDTKVENELNNMLDNIGSNQLIQSQVWHIAGFGNAFEKLDYNVGDGVVGTNYVHPMDVKRMWLTRNRRCIGYRWNGHRPDPDPAFNFNGSEIPRIAISGGKSTEDLYYPWDFLHFRRMYRMRMSEHGEPIFSDAQGIYKKLRMAIDQMVVYRAQIQPDRYAINIDVQEQPPTQQMHTVQRWKQMLRRRLAFGEGDGKGDATDFNSYNNPMSLDSILWFAQPKGMQHTITKLPGTTSVPDVYDIELLINLFFAVIGMPRWWIMGQEGGENPASGRSLMATDMRFLRKIKTIRQPLIDGYEWLAYFHETLRGNATEDLDIKTKMSEIGSLEDQIKIDILDKQADVMAKMSDIMQQFQLPPDVWVGIVFKDYLKLPQDVIDLLITNLPAEIVPQGESKAPRHSKLVEEIDKSHREYLSEVRKKITELSYGKRLRNENFNRRRRLNSYKNMLQIPEMRNGDLIVSSFGKNPLKVSAKTDPAHTNESVGTKVSFSVETNKDIEFPDADDAKAGTSTEHKAEKAGGSISENVRKFVV